MKRIEIKIVDKTLTNLVTVIQGYLDSEKIIYDGLGNEVTDTKDLSIDEFYYIDIEHIDIEDYGIYMLNGIYIELDEIEEEVKMCGYVDISEAMYFGFEDKDNGFFDGFSENEYKFEKWLELQGKTNIDLFWTTEEDDEED